MLHSEKNKSSVCEMRNISFLQCNIFQNSKKMQYLLDVGTAMGCHGCFCIILRTTSICKHGIINRKQFEKQTAEIDMIRKKFYISTRPCNRSPKGIGHGPHIPIRALQNSIIFHHHVSYNFRTLRTMVGESPGKALLSSSSNMLKLLSLQPQEIWCGLI